MATKLGATQVVQIENDGTVGASSADWVGDGNAQPTVSVPSGAELAVIVIHYNARGAPDYFNRTNSDVQLDGVSATRVSSTGSDNNRTSAAVFAIDVSAMSGTVGLDWVKDGFGEDEGHLHFLVYFYEDVDDSGASVVDAVSGAHTGLAPQVQAVKTIAGVSDGAAFGAAVSPIETVTSLAAYELTLEDAGVGSDVFTTVVEPTGGSTNPTATIYGDTTILTGGTCTATETGTSGSGNFNRHMITAFSVEPTAGPPTFDTTPIDGGKVAFGRGGTRDGSLTISGATSATVTESSSDEGVSGSASDLGGGDWSLTVTVADDCPSGSRSVTFEVEATNAQGTTTEDVVFSVEVMPRYIRSPLDRPTPIDLSLFGDGYMSLDGADDHRMVVGESFTNPQRVGFTVDITADLTSITGTHTLAEGDGSFTLALVNGRLRFTAIDDAADEGYIESSLLVDGQRFCAKIGYEADSGLYAHTMHEGRFAGNVSPTWSTGGDTVNGDLETPASIHLLGGSSDAPSVKVHDLALDVYETNPDTDPDLYGDPRLAMVCVSGIDGGASNRSRRSDALTLTPIANRATPTTGSVMDDVVVPSIVEANEAARRILYDCKDWALDGELVVLSLGDSITQYGQGATGLSFPLILREHYGLMADLHVTPAHWGTDPQAIYSFGHGGSTNSLLTHRATPTELAVTEGPAPATSGTTPGTDHHDGDDWESTVNAQGAGSFTALGANGNVVFSSAEYELGFNGQFCKVPPQVEPGSVNLDDLLFPVRVEDSATSTYPGDYFGSPWSTRNRFSTGVSSGVPFTGVNAISNPWGQTPPGVLISEGLIGVRPVTGDGDSPTVSYDLVASGVTSTQTSGDFFIDSSGDVVAENVTDPTEWSSWNDLSTLSFDSANDDITTSISAVASHDLTSYDGVRASMWWIQASPVAFGETQDGTTFVDVEEVRNSIEYEGTWTLTDGASTLYRTTLIARADGVSMVPLSTVHVGIGSTNVLDHYAFVFDAGGKPRRSAIMGLLNVPMGRVLDDGGKPRVLLVYSDSTNSGGGITDDEYRSKMRAIMVALKSVVEDDMGGTFRVLYMSSPAKLTDAGTVTAANAQNRVADVARGLEEDEALLGNFAGVDMAMLTDAGIIANGMRWHLDGTHNRVEQHVYEMAALLNGGRPAPLSSGTSGLNRAGR